MIQPPLDSTPIGTNTENKKILHLGSIPVGTKTPIPSKKQHINQISKIQIGLGFAPASDLFSYLYRITDNDIFKVQGNL